MEPVEGVITKVENIEDNTQVVEINENDNSIMVSSYDDTGINVFNDKPGTKRFYGLSDAGIGLLVSKTRNFQFFYSFKKTTQIMKRRSNRAMK